MTDPTSASWVLMDFPLQRIGMLIQDLCSTEHRRTQTNLCCLLQENLKAFHNKSQVWKAKLQTCPEPETVGYVTYVSNNILASDLIYNVLAVAEKENKCKIEIAVQLEAAFSIDPERKIFI